MTPATYDQLVKLEKFQMFDLPRCYQHIDPESHHEVDGRTPLEFYAWCASFVLADEPIPILLDVPF